MGAPGAWMQLCAARLLCMALVFAGIAGLKALSPP